MERSKKKELKVSTSSLKREKKSSNQSPLLNFNLAFDFDFGFDSEDEMSGLKKKARSEEEINKCATNEDYSAL